MKLSVGLQWDSTTQLSLPWICRHVWILNCQLIRTILILLMRSKKLAVLLSTTKTDESVSVECPSVWECRLNLKHSHKKKMLALSSARTFTYPPWTSWWTALQTSKHHITIEKLLLYRKSLVLFSIRTFLVISNCEIITSSVRTTKFNSNFNFWTHNGFPL